MDLTLVVMAAGMGSRFGGLKQLTPVDEDENFIIDYSVYDAILAGFTKVVFVIRKEHLSLFEESIGKRLEGKTNVSYAFQSLEDIPKNISLEKREKPWGTVQALLAARPYVNGSFVVINADDFYGRKAFFTAAEFLNSVSEPYTYANISYTYKATKSLNGSVKRGVLKVLNDCVTSIVECSISLVDEEIVATPLLGGDSFVIQEDTPVSMNFFAFQSDVFPLLEEYFHAYFLQEEEEILKGEVLLPECLEKNILSGKIRILNRPSDSLWLGMTYKEDLPVVKTNIQFLKDTEKLYKKHLWEDFYGKRD